MERKRELILANLLSLLIVAVALVAGWWQEALFGLAVLAVMDVLVLVRQRFGRHDEDKQE
jgi:membrane protein implicated in regulation of membrane protease activity